MLLLGILVFGISIGWIASWLVEGRGSRDFGRHLVVGLAGSFIGGTLISLLAGDGFNLRASGILGSIAGAVLLVLILDFVASKRAA
jgi:uncharacterized membrane protein YeaQ/YmgE (transglycosylase-associated protein family)